MNPKTRRWAIAAGAVAILALVAYPLMAQVIQSMDNAKDTLKAMEGHKITLIKAIEVAEKHTEGKALRAAALMHEKDLLFHVWCLKGEKIMFCTVDGKTAKATKAEEVKEVGAMPAKGETKKDSGKKVDKPDKPEKPEHKEPPKPGAGAGAGKKP